VSVTMEERMERATPLIDRLQAFCHGHLRGDRGDAAVSMLALVRGSWLEIPEVNLEVDAEASRTADELALDVVREVSEMIATLVDATDTQSLLGWSRASLISSLENYLIAIGR
jgi:hypothetical protein